MITQTPWIERKFEFNFPVGLFPVIIERLKGTMLQLEMMLADLPEAALNKKVNNKWSVKEEVGHLNDLEPLWFGRIEDFLSGKEELRPADMTNAATTAANHNDKTIRELLDIFYSSRKKLIKKVADIDGSTAVITALHPRLKQPMRLIDSLFFVAEHDDHHLTRIRQMI